MEFLRNNMSEDISAIMPLTMNIEKNKKAPFSGVRLRLAEFDAPDHGNGRVWAYLTPSGDAEISPSMTIQVEMEAIGVDEARIIPVLSEEDAATGEYLDLAEVKSYVHAQSYGELFAFVCYWFIAVADHVVPITQTLLDDLNRLCGREAFREEMKAMRSNVISDVSPTEADQSEQIDESDVLVLRSPYSDYGDAESVISDTAISQSAAPAQLHQRARQWDTEVAFPPRTHSQASSRQGESSTSIAPNTRRAIRTGERTLSTLLVQKNAISDQIRKSLSSLPLLYDMERKLQRQIDQARAKETSQANDSSEE